MRFLYSPLAGDDAIAIGGEQFLHLKARRVREGERVFVRNLLDDFLYEYKLENLARREAVLSIVSKSISRVFCENGASIAWSVVDPKMIEKTLSFLNELGVKRLTLVWSEKSQRNFRLDFERCDRILTASCEQCGRSQKMPIEVLELSDFVAKIGAENIVVLDFGSRGVKPEDTIGKTLLIGAEGGFGKSDREILKNAKTLSIDSPLILRSETAAIYAASIAL